MLRLAGRAVMNEQVAKFDIRVTQVIAEDLFTEILVEELSCWRFAIELAALMARARKRDVGLGVVCHEAAEEWWQ